MEETKVVKKLKGFNHKEKDPLKAFGLVYMDYTKFQIKMDVVIRNRKKDTGKEVLKSEASELIGEYIFNAKLSTRELRLITFLISLGMDYLNEHLDLFFTDKEMLQTMYNLVKYVRRHKKLFDEPTIKDIEEMAADFKVEFMSLDIIDKVKKDAKKGIHNVKKKKEKKNNG